MLLPEQVKELIAAIVPCEHIEVEGDGHHFFAVIVSSANRPPFPSPPKVIHGQT